MVSEVRLTLHAKKPWWFGLAFRAVFVWAWLGLPFDQDRTLRWIAASVKVSSE